MNDRLPGTSWDNPIRYKKYRIYLSDFDHPNVQFAYTHEDFDGAEDANDSRHGHAASVEEAKAQIDEVEG